MSQARDNIRAAFKDVKARRAGMRVTINIFSSTIDTMQYLIPQELTALDCVVNWKCRTCGCSLEKEIKAECVRITHDWQKNSSIQDIMNRFV